MSSFLTEVETANAVSVRLSDDLLTVELDDGRIVSVPMSWYPRLYHATKDERLDYRLISNGSGIHWERIDEDISIKGILAGHRSQESQSSLDKWLKSRKNED